VPTRRDHHTRGDAGGKHLHPVTVMLCYGGTTVVLQIRYDGAALVLHWC
jgi:hypothetical protein